LAIDDAQAWPHNGIGGSARRTSRRIDLSDIPDSSPEQLKAMSRVGGAHLSQTSRGDSSRFAWT